MTYLYYENGGGIFHMEVSGNDGFIMMCLDPNDSEHKQIIDAINSNEKALKYAEYLASGGCDKFDLTEILTTINS